jgi:hypothetical protein
MIGRRRFSMLVGAALVAPRAFAASGADEATPRLLPHDKTEARAEFGSIVAMFDRADVAAFLAYGPPAIISYDSPEVDGRKQKLSREQLPEFLADRSSNGGRKDEAPIRIESFARMTKVLDHAVYHSSLKRSAYFDEFCEVEGDCRPAGYGPMYEQWRVWFQGPRIRLLEQLLVLA